ncbi:MAG TPA: M48 family metalloprotease [Kofleriaceae bacterium]|nr:M48 family metalloprotease [Kofleriaceae bacterium]
MRALAVALLVAACGGAAPKPQLLGAPLPARCETEPTRCFAAVRDRQLAAQLVLEDDGRLRAYVQRVVDRVAAVSTLPRAPRIVIEATGSTAYVIRGGRLAISRALLVRLANEAELAGVIAHELAHLEGAHAELAEARLPRADWLASRRDAEAIADERAVELLARAGYPPVALATLYERRQREHPEDATDDEHPRIDQSVPRLRRLAAGRERGFVGRQPLLDGVAGTIVGHDTRLGTRVGDTWVVARLGVALPVTGTIDEVPAEHRMREVDQRTEVYVVSAAYGDELASGLAERRVRTMPIGVVTTGIMPRRPRRETPLGRALDAWRDQVLGPDAGTQVALVRRSGGTLVIESPSEIEQLAVLHTLRAPTPAERTAAEPPRVVLVTAPRGGTVRELASLCPDATIAIELDDPTYRLAPGDRLKCTTKPVSARDGGADRTPRTDGARG